MKKADVIIPMRATLPETDSGLRLRSAAASFSWGRRSLPRDGRMIRTVTAGQRPHGRGFRFTLN